MSGLVRSSEQMNRDDEDMCFKAVYQRSRSQGFISRSLTRSRGSHDTPSALISNALIRMIYVHLHYMQEETVRKKRTIAIAINNPSLLIFTERHRNAL